MKPQQKYSPLQVHTEVMTKVRTYAYRRSLEQGWRVTIRSIFEEAVLAYIADHDSNHGT